MPKEGKKPKKRTLQEKLRDASLLYGDGSTPKRPKSLKTKTPKGGISVSEETEKGQSAQAQEALKKDRPLPAVPKKTTMGTKFSPNVSFADILEDEAVANATAESDMETASSASTAAAAAAEHAAADSLEESDINLDAVDLVSPHNSSEQSVEDDDDASSSESEDDDESEKDDAGGQQGGTGDPTAVAVVAQGPQEPAGGPRRASAPVSSLQDDAGFVSILNSVEGPAGWRKLFKDGNPFTGSFEEADPDAAARKTAAVFDCMSKLISRLQTENTQFADRLVSAEGDKKSLLAAATSAAAGGAAAAVSKDVKWRKNFSFKKKFDAKSNENVEEFLRDLDFALTKAQVHNEEQKLHTLLDALGEVTSSDYVMKSEELKMSKGLSLNFNQSVAYLRRRWPRLESRGEILKKFKTMKMAQGQDMRAFLVELDNLLQLMKLHSLERGAFDIVDAYKDKCDAAVVQKVLALDGSQEKDEEVEWWKEHLIKFRGEASTGSLNAMVAKGAKGTKGRTKTKTKFSHGKRQFDQERPAMTKIAAAVQDGDDHVKFLYLKSKEGKELWRRRMELRAAGGKPQDQPELFKWDKHFERYNESGKVKPGYPIPVCVTCGLTWHTAGTHRDFKNRKESA